MATTSMQGWPDYIAKPRPETRREKRLERLEHFDGMNGSEAIEALKTLNLGGWTLNCPEGGLQAPVNFGIDQGRAV
jgi:hypothetical protein